MELRKSKNGKSPERCYKQTNALDLIRNLTRVCCPDRQMIVIILNMSILILFIRCKCGNCDRHSLQNISECYCCQELDGCVEAFTSEPVLQDLAPNAKLVCITDHPGFNPVCLEKWSLRLAADKYKTKGKKKYGQTGSEERWVEFVVKLDSHFLYANATPAMIGIMSTYRYVPRQKVNKLFPLLKLKAATPRFSLCRFFDSMHSTERFEAPLFTLLIPSFLSKHLNFPFVWVSRHFSFFFLGKVDWIWQRGGYEDTEPRSLKF